MQSIMPDGTKLYQLTSKQVDPFFLSDYGKACVKKKKGLNPPMPIFSLFLTSPSSHNIFGCRAGYQMLEHVTTWLPWGG